MNLDDSSIQTPASLGGVKLATYLNPDNEHVQVVLPVGRNLIASGTLAAVGHEVGLNVQDASSVVVTVAGTFAVRFIFEGSLNGLNYYPIRALRHATGAVESTLASTLSSEASWLVDVTAWAFMRVRCTTYTSGSCAVTLSGSAQPAPFQSVDSTPLAAGTNMIGNINVTTAAGTGATYRMVVSAATTNPLLVKAAAGVINGAVLSNANPTAWRWLKIYAKATAPVTATDTAVIALGIPPNSTVCPTFQDCGVDIATGIGLAITANPALNDNTAIGANEVTALLQYI